VPRPREFFDVLPSLSGFFAMRFLS
jgi:hypothetical protein